RKSAEEVTAPGKAGADDAAAAAQALPQFLRPIYLSEVTARLREAVSTERPFIERLTQFWSNHFAVSVDKQLLSGLAGSLEREAIRPHVLGTFGDLLLAVETHAAMLLYLDNHLSVGPHSPAALRLERRAQPRRLGINENLAREILELHTLGVGGGYTQRRRSANGLSRAHRLARSLGAAARQVQDTVGLHHLGFSRAHPAGAGRAAGADALWRARPENVGAGIARRLAGSQRRLGWRLR